MKKLWAALGLLIPAVYLLGRWVGRKQQPIVITPPAVHVHAPVQSAQPLLGRLVKTREGLDRYKILVDPYVIAVVALAGAVAAGVFAWKSNSLNDAQTKLLNRQIDLQASQALPIFEFSHELDQSPKGRGVRAWLLVTNRGGLARNFSIRFFYVTDIERFIFSHSKLSSTQLIHVPSFDPSFNDGETDFPQTVGDQTLRVGWSLSDKRLSLSRAQDIVNHIAGNYGMVNESVYVYINYQDYQGNYQTECYLLQFTYEKDYGQEYQTLVDPVFAWQQISPIEGNNNLEKWNADYNAGIFINRDDDLPAMTKVIEQAMANAVPTPVARRPSSPPVSPIASPTTEKWIRFKIIL